MEKKKTFVKRERPAGMGDDRKGMNPKFKKTKKKVCAFCADNTKTIDYKDVAKLSKFVTEKGKMVSRRQNGTCARHQRELSVCIKKARMMALMPFVGDKGK